MNNEQDAFDATEDPRLTAFALGELSGAEHDEVEQLVRSSPALAAEVEAIRGVAATLQRELVPVAGAQLAPEQRETIVQGSGARPRRRRSRAAGIVYAVVGGVAATFCIAFAIELFSGQRLFPGAETASHRRVSDLNGFPLQHDGGNLGREELALLDRLGYGGDGAEVDALEALENMGYMGDDEKFLPYDRAGARAVYTWRDTSESYAPIFENRFVQVTDDPRSTFSIDVDTASYSNLRRFLSDGQLPPPDAVRIEELVNYFSYDDAPPTGDAPFATHVEVADCPWAPGEKLVRIGLKGRELMGFPGKPKNLVFLIDVSGSMSSDDKLGLLKRSMRLLVQQLTAQDRLSLVVYAGASGVVLPATGGLDQERILAALEQLEAGGSTNGAAGIELAYQVAEANFQHGGINRVVLATDGDFNVGVSTETALEQLIERKRESGVFLSVLGFGTGNLQDSKMERLADHGNGNYAYIDSVAEARKVLVNEIGGTLETIAKDVKIQVEFNPREVQSFRLIGYENRVLAHADFNDDRKDAGDIGAGHSITALYQIVPINGEMDGEGNGAGGVDALRYQRDEPAPNAGELLTVKLRYKRPAGNSSRLIELPVFDRELAFEQASDDLRFAASVAAFGMVLRQSEHRGKMTMEEIFHWARGAAGLDPFGHRREFLRLLDRAEPLLKQRARQRDFDELERLEKEKLQRYKQR